MKLQANAQVEIKQKKQRRKRAVWGQQQRKKYFIFISGNKQIFNDKSISKSAFQEMSLFIGSDKDSEKCYSFHDRMKQSYKNYENIIQKIKGQLKCSENELASEIQSIRNQKFQAFKRVQELKQRIQLKKKKCLLKIQQDSSQIVPHIGLSNLIEQFMCGYGVKLEKDNSKKLEKRTPFVFKAVLESQGNQPINKSQNNFD